MSDFNAGGIPTPDYDSEDVNFVNQKTEFTDDVYVYGKLYADFGGDLNSFTGDVEVFQKNFPTSKVTLHGGTIELTRDPNFYDPADGAFIDFKSTIGEDFDCRISQTNDNGLRFETGGQGVANTKFTIAPDGQVVFKPMTQTERDALTAQTGGVIYNSTTNKLQCWNGSSWNNLF